MNDLWWYIVQTFKLCGALGLLLAVTYGPCYLIWLWGDYGHDKRHVVAQWVGATLAVLVSVGWVGVIVWAIDKDENGNGRHSWEGGSGPNTECFYEDRNQVVIVGKVPVNTNHVYTVCIDAKGPG